MFSQVAAADRCLKMAQSLQRSGNRSEQGALGAEAAILSKEIEPDKQRDQIVDYQVLEQYFHHNE